MPEHIRQEPKVLVSTENLTEQEWLAYRRRGIGGSDVAAILGISPFRTARDLYDDKLNIASVADDAGNWVALEMGHLLEPLVARIFAKKTGLEVFQIKKMFQHPQYPFMLADVDYFVRLPNGKIAILEIKTTNYNAKDHWWKDGEDCVGSYIDRVAEGRCLIVFVRRVEEPKKPYVTVEVRDGKIAQIHGDHNSDPTEEVKKFVDLWSRKVLPMALRAV